MSRFRRQLMMASMGEPVPPTPPLPYDAEVEWIQTDGSAYIDTGVKTANTTQFNITLRLSSLPSGEFWLFGARVALGNGALSPYWKGSSWEWRYGSKTVNGSSFTLATNTNYTFSNVDSSRILKVNDNYSITATANTFSTNNNFYIFAMNNNGSAVRCLDGLQFVSGEIYVSGTKVRDYIPVRKDGVGYLYDKVSGQLFGNARDSGSFTYGNDIVQVEYLGGSGTQYINCGFKATTTTKIEVKFNLGVSATQAVYGYVNSKKGMFFGTGSNSSVFCNFTDTAVSTTLSTNTDYTIIQKETSLNINGTSYTVTATEATNGNIILFARNNNGTIQRMITGKIYYFKAYDNNDNLIIDFIPVRVGQVGYMYDKVSGILFGNSGTGNFTIGNDITT